MTLFQIVRSIEKAAALQPNVRTVVRNDVFRLNAIPHVHYGVVAWLQNEHTTDADSSLIDYGFTLFYVDRLAEDGGNEVEIQSVGIQVLENILQTLMEDGVFPGAYTFRPFNQRFADECAGVYCEVRLQVMKDGMCATDYGLDGSDDALVLQKDSDTGGWVWEAGDNKVYFI